MLMLWGFFKKLAVADQIGMYVNNVYSAPDKYSGMIHLIACVLFFSQVYCDFSGYSDIAIGASRILGIRLTTNFRNCFFARSIPDLWRRWHITLNRWLNDYMYMPVFRKLRRRISHTDTVQFLALMAVFLTFGLWHGSSWNFIIWGGLNGLLVFMTHILKKRMSPLLKKREAWKSFWEFLGVPGTVLRFIVFIGQASFIFTLESVAAVFFVVRPAFMMLWTYYGEY